MQCLNDDSFVIATNFRIERNHERKMKKLSRAYQFVCFLKNPYNVSSGMEKNLKEGDVMSKGYAWAEGYLSSFQTFSHYFQVLKKCFRKIY